MMLFVVIGIIILAALGVVGFLFYLLSKQSAIEQEQQVKPISTLGDLKTFSEMPQSTQVIADMTREHAIKEQAYQKKVVELESELNTIAQKAQEQSKQAMASVEELKKENEQLKSERSNKDVALQANLIKADQTINVMREEQAGLQGRLDDSQAQVGKLQEEITAFRHQMQEEVGKTKSELEHLTVENEGLKRSMEDAIALAVKNVQDEISALKQENQNLLHANQDLTTSNQNLTQLNTHLMEKAEGLEWELTKSRAQMTSFERACDNYQNQLKDAFSKAGSIEDNTSKLSEENNRLQSVLEELKRENEELSKREKLFESELEKTRSQIVSLERAYESLRANKE